MTWSYTDDDGHYDLCEVILLYSLDMHFSNSDGKHLLRCFLAIYMFGEVSIKVFCTFFDWVVWGLFLY